MRATNLARAGDHEFVPGTIIGPSSSYDIVNRLIVAPGTTLQLQPEQGTVITGLLVSSNASGPEVFALARILEDVVSRLSMIQATASTPSQIDEVPPLPGRDPRKIRLRLRAVDARPLPVDDD